MYTIPKPFYFMIKRPATSLKLFFLFFSSIFISDSFGQTTCAIGFIPNSNQISYNQQYIDSTLEAFKYNAFFLGEDHTIDFEPEFKFNFIKHLYSLYGVRNVLRHY